jgi:hypothetical protein
MTDRPHPRRPSTTRTDTATHPSLPGLLADDEDASGRDDSDRGQSNLVGFMILMGFIAVLFTIAQVHVAPQVRADTEYDHASEVLKGAADIQADTIEVAAAGTQRSSTLQLGSSYPSYIFLVHPPGPAGTIKTGNSHALQLENAEAVRNETDDHIDGSTQTFTQHPVRYSPQYAEFTSAGDTVIEHGTLYQDYTNSERLIATPNLVNGNQLTLIATTGDFAKGSQRAKVIETVPLSASTESVLITDTGDPISIRFQTDLPESKWGQILADEIDATGNPNNDRYITDISNPNGNTIAITLETGHTYEADYAKLGYKLGEQAAFPNSADPDPAYLTTREPTTQTVETGATEEFVVQARDRYSNPVSNTVVESTAAQGDADAISQVTRQDGTVTIIYEAPDTAAASPDTLTVRFRDLTGLPTDDRTVTFEIKLQD